MLEDLLTVKIPYFSDSGVLFRRVASLPGAMFLDSGCARGERSGIDILAARPTVFLVNHNSQTRVWQKGGVKTWRDKDPFALLSSFLAPHLPRSEFPFVTGAIGFVSYDYGRRLENIPSLTTDYQRIPDVVFGIYDWAVVVDHGKRRSLLLALPGVDKKEFEHALGLLRDDANGREETPFRAVSELRSNMSKQDYLRKFDAVMKYIRDGDCYQVNLAQMFSVTVAGSAWRAYRELQKLNPSPYSAYLNCGAMEILSFSPEKFLSHSFGDVATSPIKGTRPRFKNGERDAQSLKELLNSEKDRAENLMIVDLLRNDFSKSCSRGSVKVQDLFNLESYANVHHMVSVIKGKLAPGKSVFDLLLGCFPGGSVTGAPKVRAMEIIEELEPHRRGVYCGAIGYFSRCGSMEFNIAIRTAIRKKSNFVFYGGGGIVADSVGAAEYQETLDKVSPFLRLFGDRAEKFAKNRDL